MPQEFHVLRCFSCEAFQVHLVKKVPKWSCKMCGEKQSLRKVYGMGTGQECRCMVQSLNKQRLTAPKVGVEMSEWDDEGDLGEGAFACTAKASKWGQFVGTEDPGTPETASSGGSTKLEPFLDKCRYINKQRLTAPKVKVPEEGELEDELVDEVAELPTVVPCRATTKWAEFVNAEDPVTPETAFRGGTTKPEASVGNHVKELKTFNICRGANNFKSEIATESGLQGGNIFEDVDGIDEFLTL